MKITFINPSNAYSETYNTIASPIWCFFFGCFYWLVRGNFAHAIISFGAAFFTCGISWLVYPLFANRINIRSYQRKGWVVKSATVDLPVQKGIRRVTLEPQAKPPRFKLPRLDDYRSRWWWTPIHEWYWTNWKWAVPLSIAFVVFDVLMTPVVFGGK